MRQRWEKLRVLAGPEEKTGDETALSDDVFERLRHETTIQVLREQLSAQQQLISQKSPTPPKKSQASKK